jgi:hypothetical protein
MEDMETTMSPESNRRVLRTALVPKELDLELRNRLAGVSVSSKSVGEAIQGIVYASLDRLREDASLPKIKVDQSSLLVLRTVWVSDIRDNELKKYAFRRGQRRGELIIDMISSEVARHLSSATQSQLACNN